MEKSNIVTYTQIIDIRNRLKKKLFPYFFGNIRRVIILLGLMKKKDGERTLILCQIELW